MKVIKKLAKSIFLIGPFIGNVCLLVMSNTTLMKLNGKEFEILAE